MYKKTLVNSSVSFKVRIDDPDYKSENKNERGKKIDKRSLTK